MFTCFISHVQNGRTLYLRNGEMGRILPFTCFRRPLINVVQCPMCSIIHNTYLLLLHFSLYVLVFCRYLNKDRTIHTRSHKRTSFAFLFFLTSFDAREIVPVRHFLTLTVSYSYLVLLFTSSFGGYGSVHCFVFHRREEKRNTKTNCVSLSLILVVHHGGIVLLLSMIKSKRKRSIFSRTYGF